MKEKNDCMLNYYRDEIHKHKILLSNNEDRNCNKVLFEEASVDEDADHSHRNVTPSKSSLKKRKAEDSGMIVGASYVEHV